MRKTNAPSQPFGRLIAACGILLAVVLVSALMTTFLQKPNLDALADNAATAAPEFDPTPTPEPTITPTPAVYAPFGAQYGYGGANLIPETPTPDPVSVTPTPTTAPTDTPKPTKAPTRTLKKNFTGEDVKQLQQALIDLGYLNDAGGRHVRHEYGGGCHPLSGRQRAERGWAGRRQDAGTAVQRQCAFRRSGAQAGFSHARQPPA